MRHEDRLQQVLSHPRIWRAGSRSAGFSRNIATGWPHLDEALGGGWPSGRLTEVLIDTHGIGELRLLIPAFVALTYPEQSVVERAQTARRPWSTHQASIGERLRRPRPQGRSQITGFCQSAARWVMLLAPPYIPYAPALESHGCDLSRLLVVHSKRHMDTLWAMEQALRSGSCAAVVAWSGLNDDRALRRLQLAAEETDCWAVLFRLSCFQSARSPAALRLRLLRTETADGLTLQILKQRSGRPAVVRVDL